MAESFVFGIAKILLGKIASLVTDEVTLAWGLETDLKKLQELLATINVVSLDAEKQQTQNQELRRWLGMLKNFCYDAEDVLDELEYESLCNKVLKENGNIKVKVCRFFSSSNPLVFPFIMGHKVKELRERLDEIAYHRSNFRLAELDDSPQVGLRSREMTDSLLRMSNVIGRDGDKEKILELLLHSKEGGTISVIPIVGLGGIGKTTLAKMLYNDQSVDKHFDIKIWVCVAETFKKKQIMVNVLKSLTNKDRSNLDPDQLQRKIQKKLNSKRFLLVLDDIWNNHRGKWIKIQELFEGGAAGSKVIVTTRNSSVADIVRTVPLHRLEGLSNQQCLFLFKKLAFREGEEESHPRLMEIGDDIVKKCGGIPLAVKTMGNLLYSKTDEHYWKSIRDSETWNLEQEEDDILPALRLSYDQLPSHLKPCFAICSIFPKDYKFESVELIRIWIANGLLQFSNNQQDIEDIGVQYIKELYLRSFLQDFEEYRGVMTFKMHDLVHDLVLSISQSECFVVNTHIDKVPDGIRYLAFPEKDSLDQKVPGFLQKENSLRTIIFPRGRRPFLKESFVNKWMSSSKYLRMLNLRGFPLEGLPSSIGGLKHLRSLDLTFCKIKRLPDSIWKLHNLLFLHLLNCLELEELPKDVRKLIKLRSLSITVKQKRLPNDGIGCLRSLRVLRISTCSNLEYLFEDIEHLTSLHSLEVWSCDKLISLPHNLMSLNAVKDLLIVHCNQFNWKEEYDIEDINLSLRSLRLHKLPQVVTLPRWLQKSFNTLQRLEIIKCENFSSFPEWLQDFTALEKIEIDGCPKLVFLPEWMHRLTSLKELRIRGCPLLSERCKRLEGEDWHKIAHIPNIYIEW